MILLLTEVNPDGLNNYGRALLSYPAWNGHEGAVGMLLEREEVNPAGADTLIVSKLSLHLLLGGVIGERWRCCHLTLHVTNGAIWDLEHSSCVYFSP